jgi:hypothetical protein
MAPSGQWPRLSQARYDIQRGVYSGSKVVRYATKTCDRTVVSLVSLQNVNEAELGKTNEAKKEIDTILARCGRHVQNKGFRTGTLLRAWV